MIVSGVNVVADPTLSREEIIHLVAEEKTDLGNQKQTDRFIGTSDRW